MLRAILGQWLIVNRRDVMMPLKRKQHIRVGRFVGPIVLLTKRFAIMRVC